MSYLLRRFSLSDLADITADEACINIHCMTNTISTKGSGPHYYNALSNHLCPAFATGMIRERTSPNKQGFSLMREIVFFQLADLGCYGNEIPRLIRHLRDQRQGINLAYSYHESNCCIVPVREPGNEGFSRKHTWGIKIRVSGNEPYCNHHSFHPGVSARCLEHRGPPGQGGRYRFSRQGHIYHPG